MTTEEAVNHILGEKLASAITEDLGLHWTVITAMCKATTDHNPDAIAAIRLYNEALKDGAP
jgi:hypothetical protein